MCCSKQAILVKITHFLVCQSEFVWNLLSKESNLNLPTRPGKENHLFLFLLIRFLMALIIYLLEWGNEHKRP